MLLLLLAFAADPAPAAELVPGKFGKALDAARTPRAFTPDARYRTAPFTVECWTKLRSRADFNVLVSCDDKASADHWELYSYAKTGHLAAYLPGYEPSEIISTKNVADGEWHHAALTFDGKAVTLYLDGKRVVERPVKKRSGMKPQPGPLFVGMATEGSRRVGCDGLIDEVHFSRVLRTIDALPTAAPKLDADTVAIWRFDGSDRVLADPAWTPPPTEAGEKWEKMTDVDWVDDRFRKTDTGPTFDGTIAFTHGRERVVIPKGLAIRVGDKGEGGLLFDRANLRWCAGWAGGFLKHSDRRFGLLNTPLPDGALLFHAGVPKAGNTLPIPHDQGRFNGLYLHGKRTIVSYTLAGVEVLESPWYETARGKPVLTRALEIGPTKAPLEILAGSYARGVQIALHDPTHECRLVTEGGETRLRVPASDRPRRLVLLYPPATPGRPSDLDDAVDKLIRGATPPDLSAWLKPGPSLWPAEIVTKGELAKNDAPYVVDTLTVPYKNPFNALFFLTGVDFLPDGRIAVCTCHGDVWTVAADPKLDKVRWRRYATGLYHPLGLKVIDGKVVVLERGQLTRLHGKDYAHHYENLCHDWHTGSGEHSYDTCLETDAEGNFFFFKTGDTHLPHGGCLMKVSKDGKKVEVFATGFRHPIGLGLSADGLLTGADQEGNWMPSTRVDVYKKGGFYGDMRAHHRATPPKTFDPPLLWIPKDVDNSAGGQATVPHDRFGLPKGQLLHLSYGRCKLLAIHRQKVEDVEQGAVIDLGVTFLSGSARGRFHPTDGALYVVGLNGWQTAAKADGSLQRVRYTGKGVPFVHDAKGRPMLLSHRVYEDRIELNFGTLVPNDFKDGWLVEQWDYKYSGDYGSKRWSVRNPGREGVDRLDVTAVEFDSGHKIVTLKVKGLRPAMQMRVGHAATKTVVHSTVHRLEKR